MGERTSDRNREIAALKHAIDSGVRLIDTAEMYGEGEAERVVGAALSPADGDVFVVSKVYPHNGSFDGVQQACERSLSRLGRDSIDLYLLHWPGSHPIDETLDGFCALREAGKIRYFGVSNFDIEELDAIPEAYRDEMACNQVFYNLNHRECEAHVQPWGDRHGVHTMAYSPLDQGGGLLNNRSLIDLGERYSASPAQLALAWLLSNRNTIVIPKSKEISRINENLHACQLTLSADDLQLLDQVFPQPPPHTRLDMR